MKTTRIGPAALLLAFAVACSESSTPGFPLVSDLSTTQNATNALSLVVSANVRNTDSVRVTYWPISGGAASSTPFYTASGLATDVAVLGLHPTTAYTLVYEAKNATATVSDTTWAVSGNLPRDLEGVRLGVSGTATSGYELLAVGNLGSAGYAVAFDSTGYIAWYRQFPVDWYQRVDEAELQTNGHFTTYVGSTTGWQADSGAFYEYAPSGQILRTWAVKTPQYTDEHELVLTDGGEVAHFFTYDVRKVDLSPYGGAPDALVAGHSLVRMRQNGAIEFTWNAWDQIATTEWAPSGAGTDFDHPNSLAFDRDGDYIVSLRNLSQIRKIDATTGAAVWTLGRKGQFTFVNDPADGVSMQHAARILENGHLLAYDNGTQHTVRESRAVEYALDTQNMTATLVWQYRHTPAIYTGIMGYVQRLQSGNTIVSFSQVGIMNEVTPTGERLWEGALYVNGVAGSFYRARRIASLYQYRPA